MTQIIKKGGGGGGGGSPAGADGQIQFNDADEFGASPGLVWDTEGVLSLNSDDGGTAEIKGGALGVQFQLTATPGDADYPGGAVVVTAGNSDGQDGGDVQVSAGSDFSEFGSGGGVSIKSGSSLTNDGGDIGISRQPGRGCGMERRRHHHRQAGQGAHTGGDVVLGAGGSSVPAAPAACRCIRAMATRVSSLTMRASVSTRRLVFSGWNPSRSRPA
jgi:hypothetical protein